MTRPDGLSAVIGEYGSLDMELTRAQAHSLNSSRFVQVQPIANERWRVTALSHVGTLIVAGVQLMIRPKINPENLFVLLEPGLPAQAWRREVFDYAATANLLPAMVGFFARTVETTLSRGVMRHYEGRREPLIAMRGRLDLAGQFRRPGLQSPVACAYDEYSEDVIENRVLRAALRRALRAPLVDPAERSRVKRQLAILDQVSDVPIAPEAVGNVPFTRLNQHYAPALRLAGLLLANMSLVDDHGEVAASSFMVDMNDLFQRFVTERLRRALRGRVDVVSEPTHYLGVGNSVPMYPDLVFRNTLGYTTGVGDIKYKLTDTAHGRNADYYQLLAYATSLDLEEGLLIYCRPAGGRAESTVVVNNAGKRLKLRAVDLSGSPHEVENEIAVLAEEIARGRP